MGLLVSFLSFPQPTVQRIAAALGVPGQAFQGVAGPGLAAVIGFALFVGVAYLVFRAATRQPDVAPEAPADVHPKR